MYARSLTATHGELVFLSAGRLVARIDETNKDTHRDFAGHVSSCNPRSLAEGAYPQSYIVEQPKNQASEMLSDKFPLSPTFQYRKTSFKTEVWLPFGSYALDQRCGDGRLGGRSQDVAVNSRTLIPEFWDSGCEDRFLSEEDHPEFKLQEKSQSGRTEGSTGWPILSRKADRLHDLWMFLGNGRSWGWSWLFWSISHYLTCRRRSDRYLETIILESFYKMRTGGSDHLKTVLAFFE